MVLDRFGKPLPFLIPRINHCSFERIVEFCFYRVRLGWLCLFSSYFCPKLLGYILPSSLYHWILAGIDRKLANKPFLKACCKRSTVIL